MYLCLVLARAKQCKRDGEYEAIVYGPIHFKYQVLTNGIQYMNGFDCKITSPGNKVLAKPQVPVECRDGNNCILGAKQPMYWANEEHQNIEFSGEYERKPAYNDKWGF